VRTYPQSSIQKPVDYVVFKNGDRLTGSLVRCVGNSIIFKSDNVGEVTASMDKVQKLHSQGSFVVLEKHEKITLTTQQPGNMTLNEGSVTVPDVKGAPETVPTKDLGFIIDKGTYTKEVATNPDVFHRWSGFITGGATVVESSSTGRTYTADIALVRSIPTLPYLSRRTRTTFNLIETYGKITTPVIPQTTPPSPDSVAKVNIFDTGFEHDKYFTPRTYALAGLSYAHNYSEGLNFQQIYGVGVGSTVIQNSVQQLDLKVDVHYERQNFQPPTPNANLIGSTFEEAYKGTLPGKLLFTQSATYIPSWNNLHAYSAIGAAGLTMPVYKRFNLSFNVLNNYLNNPAFGYKRNSFEFVTGVTYKLP
jgi:hypothetical protein